jgi:hypothetical protein
MAPPQWTRLPTVIIAAVLIGAEVFAIVGTDPTLHGEFKCKWRSAVSAAGRCAHPGIDDLLFECFPYASRGQFLGSNK